MYFSVFDNTELAFGEIKKIAKQDKKVISGNAQKKVVNALIFIHVLPFRHKYVYFL